MYSCDIGTTGMRTPASRPSSAENIPPAITTTSASMSPRSVRTRPGSIPVTLVFVKMATPPSRAPSASANVS